jgi:hypothetical protein
LKTKCRLSYWRETQKKKVRKKRKKKKHKQINKKKRKDQKKIKKDNMFWVFFWPFFFTPWRFCSIQIQMVVLHVNNLDCWPLFIFVPRVSTLSPLCNWCFRIWFPEIILVTHISTCFLVHFVFFCFLCFLICLFHVPSFFFIPFIFSFLLMFFLFFHFSFIFISFHFCSFLFISCFYLLKKTLPIQTTCMSTIVDPLLSSAEVCWQ